MLRRLSVLAACCAALAIGAMPALAQGDVCRNLENELARLSSLPASVGNPELGRWDRAIRDQTIAIQRTEQRRRRAGCDGSSFLFRRADPAQCKALDRDIRDMRAKLAKMERGRDKVARKQTSNSGVDGQIRIIRQQIRQNACGAPQYNAASRREVDTGRDRNARIRYAPTGGGRIIARVSPDSNGVVDARPARSKGLFGLLLGGSRREDRTFENDWGGQFAGTYRTLCVRSCDGYYFPISFSTTEQSFGRDQATCSSMCPGTDARLFVHHNPGQNSEAMVSLDGQPYTELETAFRYRSEFDAACTCQRAGMADVTANDGSSQMVALTTSGDDFAPYVDYSEQTDQLAPLIAVPVAKLSFDEDPDTLANQRGEFSPQSMVQTVAANPTATGAKIAAETPHGEIRIVGPNYFVAQ